jgi:N-dimethylarginine dimethylaminohydrolase
MGKPLRRGEETALERKLNSIGVPTLYRLHGEATAEGGDTLWLNEHLLAVGNGYRTNAEGIQQLKEAVAPLDVRVMEVPLPYWDGTVACLHLQSLISLVDEKKAVVYLPLLPVFFVEFLKKEGFLLIEVPTEEFNSMGPNVLCLRPNLVLTLEGNPITRRRMEEAGVKVLTYKGDEISHKGAFPSPLLTPPFISNGFSFFFLELKQRKEEALV